MINVTFVRWEIKTNEANIFLHTYLTPFYHCFSHIHKISKFLYLTVLFFSHVMQYTMVSNVLAHANLKH